MSDFLIIGGGVIGLLLARELADSGAKVTVIERGECCREASWAGGGIVSPLYPWRYKPEVTALASWAQDFYPQLAAELLRDTGIDSELQKSGLLMLQAEDSDAALQWARETRRPMQAVAEEFIYKKEARLAANFTAGLWMNDVCNIRNPRLGKALVVKLRDMPDVQLREHCELLSINQNADKIQSVEVLEKGDVVKLQAQKYVVSAGAWSGVLLAGLGVELPVEPVKGQMLLYRSQENLLQSIVLYRGRYLIPRRDGYILVGSTLEKCEFDKSSIAEALSSLRESAVGMLPELALLDPIQQWAGLRPGAPDGVPFIGRVKGFDNLFVNAGHYRNGLVLAPASARLLADLLLQRTPIVDPSPYDPQAV